MNSLSLLRPAGLHGHQHCDMSDKKFHNERCKVWVFYNGTVPKKWKLQEAIKKEPPQTQLLFKTCKMALKETTGFSNALIFGSADIYYIPISLIGQASTLINLYSKVRMIALFHRLNPFILGSSGFLKKRLGDYNVSFCLVSFHYKFNQKFKFNHYFI